ncbi:MAG: IscS subfamily cysteine desulfurase [Candidatus Omnitrophica bacterium]|nr:IscS subfamily cysteine desulfurase [Candidatus Omnitrophota bacterium]
MKLPIYMDHQATTPVDPRVLEAMLPYYREKFGNAASRNHAFGREASDAIEAARRQVAHLVNAEDPEEIVFTSGATESNNLAIKGVAGMFRERGTHIVTSQIEHKSVLDTAKYLETRGFRLAYLPVDREGIVDIEALREAISRNTILISIMHANNEIGTIQPIDEIGKMARERSVFFHCDLAQTAGKIPVDVRAMAIDLAGISAHKLYGPKGVGALYVRKRNPRVRLSPQIHGGGHEGGLRSGTLNVPAIVGFGRACEIAEEEMQEESKRILRLREKLRNELIRRLGDVHVNGSLKHRLPGNLNISFSNVEGETLLTEISEEIAVSSGSACSSATLEPSYVMKALGVSEALSHTAIRFGLGRWNTEAEIDYTIERVAAVVGKLRLASPIYASERSQ